MTECVTPSSIWQGSAAPGSRWTAQQLEVIRREGHDPDRIPVATIARRAKVNPDNWMMPPPVTRIQLPQLATNRRNGHVLVVTPAGAKQWMEPARG